MRQAALVVATRNFGKFREFAHLLDGLPLRLLSLRDFPKLELPPEEGDTYAANALAKARAVAAATGFAALGDDSGLEVDALGGRPGVRSARFAGEEKDDAANNRKLLALLKDVPWEKRTARFRCVLALVYPAPAAAAPFVETLVEGTCEGIIAFSPRGEHGFGYDPLFYLPDYGCTMGELPEEVKNRLSHRARAVEKARPLLEEIFGWGEAWR